MHRSNCLWKYFAASSFMNMFGFIQFNKMVIAAEVQKKSGRHIRLGRLNWHVDSYHIYGKDLEKAQQLLDKMAKKGYARMNITGEGTIQYEFPDFMIEGGA